MFEVEFIQLFRLIVASYIIQTDAQKKVVREYDSWMLSNEVNRVPKIYFDLRLIFINVLQSKRPDFYQILMLVECHDAGILYLLQLVDLFQLSIEFIYFFIIVYI